MAPEIVSMIELAKLNITCTSVQVMITWNIPEGGLTVDEYVVSYRRLNGRDGQCSSFQDEGNVSVSPRGEGETILHLKAHYSIYAVNVTGRIGALRNTSRLHFKTNSTGTCIRVCVYLLTVWHTRVERCSLYKKLYKTNYKDKLHHACTENASFFHCVI